MSVIVRLIPPDAEVPTLADIALRYYTQIYLRSFVEPELQLILGIPSNLGNYFILSIYCLCGVSVLVTTTWRVLTLRMEKRSADMESSCEYIKCTVPDISEMVFLQLCVWKR